MNKISIKKKHIYIILIYNNVQQHIAGILSKEINEEKRIKNNEIIPTSSILLQPTSVSPWNPIGAGYL